MRSHHTSAHDYAWCSASRYRTCFQCNRWVQYAWQFPAEQEGYGACRRHCQNLSGGVTGPTLAVEILGAVLAEQPAASAVAHTIRFLMVFADAAKPSEALLERELVTNVAGTSPGAGMTVASVTRYAQCLHVTKKIT